jgi:hypothetical protein
MQLTKSMLHAAVNTATARVEVRSEITAVSAKLSSETIAVVAATTRVAIPVVATTTRIAVARLEAVAIVRIVEALVDGGQR